MTAEPAKRRKKFVSLLDIPQISPEQLTALGVEPAPFLEPVYWEVGKTTSERWRLVFWRDAEDVIHVGRLFDGTTHYYGG